MLGDPMPVAEKVVLALRGAPMLLTLLVINVAVLAMVTYLTVQAANLRFAERADLIVALRGCIQQCTPVKPLPKLP